jgi:hypothetical protein
VLGNSAFLIEENAAVTNRGEARASTRTWNLLY